MTSSSVKKIITTFVKDTTDVQIYLLSLNNPEEIKASLKLTSKFTPETKTETDLKKVKILLTQERKKYKKKRYKRERYKKIRYKRKKYKKIRCKKKRCY